MSQTSALNHTWESQVSEEIATFLGNNPEIPRETLFLLLLLHVRRLRLQLDSKTHEEKSRWRYWLTGLVLGRARA